VANLTVTFSSLQKDIFKDALRPGYVTTKRNPVGKNILSVELHANSLL